MGVRKISIKTYMTYQSCLKQLMQTCEVFLNRMNDENPYLIKALDRSVNQFIIRNYSYISENTECNR